MINNKIKNENTPTLVTKRLVLRKYTAEDADSMFSLYHDKEVNTFLPWFVHKSKEETEEYLKTVILPEYKKPLAYCYAITEKPKNIVIGLVAVHNIEEAAGCAELGYALKKEFWNRGIVTEACEAVVSQLKKNGFTFLIATHDVKNPASGEVMKKLGLKYCYTFSEHCQPKDITVIFRLYQLNFDGDPNRVYKAFWEKSPNRFIEKEVSTQARRLSPEKNA